MSNEDVVFDEVMYGETVKQKYRCVLSRTNGLSVNGEKVEWYVDSASGKLWIPRKRRSIVGLIKQMIREGEMEGME